MKSPFMSTADAAVYLLYMPEGALGESRTRGLRRLEHFLARHPEIERKHRGRDVLIDKQSLDAHLDRRRHAAHSAPSRTRLQGTVGAPQQEAR